jgi:hypothetical protein
MERPADPPAEEPLRSSLPGQKIPGFGPDISGSWADHDPDKPDTVVLGHAPIAGQYTMNYDNRSRDLDADPQRMDLNFVSAEALRRRAKGLTKEDTEKHKRKNW